MFSQVANAPARLIKDFTKDAKKGVVAKPALKAAYVQESFYVGAENLEALVNIKSKNELIAFQSYVKIREVTFNVLQRFLKQVILYND